MPQPIEHPILRLAVVPLRERITPGVPQPLQDEIRSRVEGVALDLREVAPRLEVVERGRIDLAIRELEFQASGHVKDSDFVGAGRMLGADHLLVYDIAATSDDELKVLMERGGIVRVAASGKILRVQTGTVVFQQTVERSLLLQAPPPGQQWNMTRLELQRRGFVLQTIGGLFMALGEALLPSPTGVFWADVQGGDDGVRVDFVLIGSPAHQAGLLSGDLITAIDGVPVHSLQDGALRDLDMIPRDVVRITIQRRGQEQTFLVKPLVRGSIPR